VGYSIDWQESACTHDDVWSGVGEKGGDYDGARHEDGEQQEEEVGGSLVLTGISILVRRLFKEKLRRHSSHYSLL